MFVLHTSNKAEHLLEHLNTVLGQPLSSPFVSEVFLVQSQGMQRWLSQQLAEKKSVWANFEFLFPGNFFGNIVDALIPDYQTQAQINNHYLDQLFDKDSLIWCFDALLRDVENDKDFLPLQEYLQEGNSDLKRYQLAVQLAGLFDQYQFLRPNWLSVWAHGGSILDNGAPATEKDTEIWQRSLWCRLLERYLTKEEMSGAEDRAECSENQNNAQAASQGRGNLWLQVLDTLSVLPKEKVLALLPERLSVFGVNAMSPLYLHILERISQFIDVHFYLLNPTETYWADLPGKRQLARQLVKQQETAELYDVSNLLLASYGQQGRDFQQLLLEQCQFEHEYNTFTEADSNTVLARIQNDILNNTHTSEPLQPDNSLQFHSCHSAMRQVEVLKDQLLESLQTNPDLSLRDIVVMAPDISAYAAFIEAVFVDIPHAITDRSFRETNKPLRLLIDFLSLSQSRWEKDAIVALLEQPLIHKQFGLVDSDLELLRHWLEQTAIRWGESAEHRQQLGFPTFTENSWQAGIERLLMGYANACDSEFCLDILPYNNVEGSQAQILGGLADFINVLNSARQLFACKHTLKYWGIHLSALIDQLFYSGFEKDSQADTQVAITALYQMLDALQQKQVYHQQEVSLAVVIDWLNSTAASQRSSLGFMRGQLTFCSMLPMRAIPFKVIALLGMNEGEYPHQESAAAFDLMSRHFQKGDKSSRLDERYQFLETLMSVRQQLIICYEGQSQHSNTHKPPAIVVSELQDVLCEYYQLDSSDLTRTHPLQAFSINYFNQHDTRYFSYSQRHYTVCRALHNTQPEQQSDWWQGALSVDAQVVDLQELIRFYKHPQRYFLQQQLQLHIPSLPQSDEETEPFEINRLTQYQIAQQWVNELLRHCDAQDISCMEEQNRIFLQHLRAQGQWVTGNHSQILFEQQSDDIVPFVETVKSTAFGKPVSPLPVDFDLGEFRLVGRLDSQYQLGSEQCGLFYRYAKMKGSDLVTAWLYHLVALQVVPATTTWLFTKNEQCQFSAIDQSKQYLVELIKYYTSGLKSPSPLLLEPALEWQQTFRSKSARLEPIDKALSKYEGLLPYDETLRLLYQNTPAKSVIGETFIEACQLLNPIWETSVEST